MNRSLLLSLALGASLAACAAEPPDQAAAAAAARPAVPAQDGAAEARVREALESLLPGVEVTGIRPSPLPGLFEASVEGRVLYVSNDGKYLIQGALVDVQARDNLTRHSEARNRKALLDAVDIRERGVVFPAADEKHVIKVFTDIDCGFCRRMHRQIAEYNRQGITVEYLFYPRAGIGSDSFEKAVSVWCARDRRKALTDAKNGVELPRASCSNPVTMDYDLGRRVGLSGTPAVYAASGHELGGYVEPAELRARLDELSQAAGR
ncbi:DsbC family protein [Arenimonas fontis]|uniref:Thiol:disulfide interchange protein n=1 Tax=Arenimonas fontis TaxID=2608255 RepID=A0A5B2Z8D4_9GAMM|nr:DsbC family protein [Arenimonas fontis]KAA2284988.1 DsbC family protein [Arenimonas fontis]